MSKHPMLGAGVAIDVAALITSRLLLCANSGGGKSWAIRRLLEQTHGTVQQIVIDPDGEFHTLREKFDYVLFGPDGDYPATVETAALIARRLLELGTDAIIDISELGEDKPAFVAAFLTAMHDAPRELWHAVMVVVDEAHRFAPERGREKGATKEERKAVQDARAAMIALFDSGRKRGYCGVAATQRLSKLSKDVTGECNNKLIGRSLADDADRASRELGMTGREAIEKMRQLEPGEFFAFGPGISRDVVKVKMGAVTTTHPKSGQIAPRPAPPSSQVKKALEKLRDLPKQAREEARNAEQLRARVHYLEAELRAAKKATPTAPAPRPPKIVEKPVIGHRELRRIEQLYSGIWSKADVVLEKFMTLGPSLERLRIALNAATPGLDAPKVSPPAAAAAPRPAPPATPRNAPRPLPSTNGLPAMSSVLFPAQQKMLDTMALLERLGIEASSDTFCAWYGAHPRSKGLQNNLGALRSAGLVAGFALTGEGRRRARYIDPPTQEQARELIMRNLKAGQRRILEIALEHPGADRDKFGELLGKHPRTKSVANNIGALRSRGLLSEDWPLKPSQVLYLNGAN